MGILFSCFLGSFLLVFATILYKIWWTPIYLQHVMRSQGIKGPPYKFLYGNSNEIFNMKKKAMSTPMDLSHDIFPRVLPHFHAWITLYGKNFINWVGHEPKFIVTELELIKEILSDKEGAFPKIRMDSLTKKLVGNGLLMTEAGEKWIKLRKLANHAFHAESLKKMVPEMMASVESMLENWRSHEAKEIEVYSEFRDLSSEIISRTAFGSSYLDGKNIFEMLAKLGFIIFKNDNKLSFLRSRKYFKTADDKESDAIERSLRESIMSIIKKREDQVMAGRTDSYGSDFLGSLLKVHHNSDMKSRISVDDIVDECKTFYLAGHETVSSALSWTVLLLAIYTDWQDKAREELLELSGREKLKPECIARLRIMTMIINETLRLYSPVTMLTRRVRKKVRLGKLTLPADMHMFIPIYALHGNPEVWGSDAHLFKPERFAEGVTKATSYNTVAFLPFGAGPRTCVGLNFAITQMKIALSMILQHYKFTLSANYVHTPISVLTLRPQKGIQIMLHPL